MGASLAGDGDLPVGASLAGDGDLPVGASLLAMGLAGGSQPAGDGDLPHRYTASLAYRHQGGSYLCSVGGLPQGQRKRPRLGGAAFVVLVARGGLEPPTSAL